MQEALVIIIVLLAATAVIYYLICSFKAMNGEENPCRHCASSCNCRLIQEGKESTKTGISQQKEACRAGKDRKITSPCKKKRGKELLIPK